MIDSLEGPVPGLLEEVHIVDQALCQQRQTVCEFQVLPINTEFMWYALSKRRM